MQLIAKRYYSFEAKRVHSVLVCFIFIFKTTMDFGCNARIRPA